jgi:hypothetical protein
MHFVGETCPSLARHARRCWSPDAVALRCGHILSRILVYGELVAQARATCSVRAVFMTAKLVPVNFWKEDSTREHCCQKLHGTTR